MLQDTLLLGLTRYAQPGLWGLRNFSYSTTLAEDKLKLLFTTREPSLLRSASRISRHHIITT